MITTVTPDVACDACAGVLTYRVQVEGNPHPDDNFDQLSDHQPRLFTNPAYLESVASSSSATITVRHFPAGWTPDANGTVVAFAGDEPQTGTRTWFSVAAAKTTLVFA